MIGTRPWQVGPQQATADAAAVRRWVQGHREGAGSAPIWSANAPGELLAQLPRTCPPVITDIAGVLGELEQFVVPGLVRWDAPGWFAFFPSNAHPHALLGDQLGAALSQQGMLWMSSPACTELEIRVLEWLRQSIGLPECYAEGGLRAFWRGIGMTLLRAGPVAGVVLPVNDVLLDYLRTVF